MSDLRLRPLTDDELRSYAVRLEDEYAREMHEQAGVPLEAARQQARDSTQELMPDGRLLDGHQVWFAVDVDDEPVGVLWLARRNAGAADAHVWIYDIEIYEAHRGRGLGRQLLALAEAQTRAWGLESLQLNVFGRNEVARNLYRSQGFAETRVTMAKDVSAAG